MKENNLELKNKETSESKLNVDSLFNSEKIAFDDVNVLKKCMSVDEFEGILLVLRDAYEIVNNFVKKKDKAILKAKEGINEMRESGAPDEVISHAIKHAKMLSFEACKMMYEKNKILLENSNYIVSFLNAFSTEEKQLDNIDLKFIQKIKNIEKNENF